MKTTLSIMLLALLMGMVRCKSDNITASLSVCDQQLDACGGLGNGAYCTFGYKWGKSNPFANAGLEKPGPASGQVSISYKFQEAGLVFNTHSQRDVKSESFDKLPSCAKQKIREAFASWAEVADISFVEKASNEPTDIKIITANITQNGVAYPPYPNIPCTELAGLVILRYNLNYTCDRLYTLSVHEIGHVLGLGHVQSNNVMNPNMAFLELQAGDIRGVQSVYGKK
jgi:predicted Zn-dependent protease